MYYCEYCRIEVEHMDFEEEFNQCNRCYFSNEIVLDISIAFHLIRFNSCGHGNDKTRTLLLDYTHSKSYPSCFNSIINYECNDCDIALNKIYKNINKTALLSLNQNDMFEYIISLYFSFNYKIHNIELYEPKNLKQLNYELTIRGYEPLLNKFTKSNHIVKSNMINNMREIYNDKISKKRNLSYINKINYCHVNNWKYPYQSPVEL